MAAYNGEPFVERAVRSVLYQTVTDLELVVVDDGSTDGTADRVRELADSRVRLLRQDNAGPSAARNTGIGAARGAWVAFLDCDDWWTPDKLEQQLACAASYPDAALIYSGAERVGPDGKTLGRMSPELQGMVLEPLLFGNRITGSASSAMVSRRVLTALGGFRIDLYCGEDWDMWLRIAAKHSVRFVDRQHVSLSYREGGQARKVGLMRDSCLRLLDDAFRTYASHLMALRRQAEIAVHIRAAIDYEILGDARASRAELIHVLRRDPGDWHIWRRLALSFAGRASKRSREHDAAIVVE